MTDRLMEQFRCLPTRIGWAHRIPHYGCPKEVPLASPPRGSLPWDRPDADPAGDRDAFLAARNTPIYGQQAKPTNQESADRHREARGGE